MADKQLKDLLRKFLDGTITEEEEARLDQWYATLGDDDGTGISEDEKRAIGQRLWMELESKIGNEKSRSRRLWPTLAAAATFTGLALWAVLTYPELSRPDPEHFSNIQEETTVVNKGTTARTFTLVDGSRVTLDPGSTLGYGPGFNVNGRRVRLQGEAFFEVAHNPEQPFCVVTDEVVTKVLGTSFTVRAIPGDRQVTVAVKTGRVSVYTRENVTASLPAEPEVILTPNQEAVYSRDHKQVEHKLVAQPEVIVPQEEIPKVFRFESAPVSEVFAAIETLYGVDIVYEEETLAGCSITTTVAEEEFYDRMDVICKIIGATYSEHEARIVVTGPGCQ